MSLREGAFPHRSSYDPKSADGSRHGCIHFDECVTRFRWSAGVAPSEKYNASASEHDDVLRHGRIAAADGWGVQVHVSRERAFACVGLRQVGAHGEAECIVRGRPRLAVETVAAARVPKPLLRARLTHAASN